MRFTKMGGLAALLGVSHAFLIPPTISPDDLHIEVQVIPFDITTPEPARDYILPCPGCPVAGAVGVLHAAESVLRFNISVQHTNDQQPYALMINNLQAFPQSTKPALSAEQFIKTSDGKLAYVSTPELGFALLIKDTSDLEVHLRITEVGGTFVRGIPTIGLRFMKTPGGNLIWAPSAVPTRPAASDSEKCLTLLCRWKAAIADKVNALKKGCGSKNGAKNGEPHRISRPHGIKGGHPRPEGYGRPPHRRPRHGTIGRILRGIIFHVVVPVLIGIALGITASIIGMMVGHFTILLWRVLFRRGERAQYCRVKQEETVEEADGEGAAFLDNQGPPPVYEEVVVDVEKVEQ